MGCKQDDILTPAPSVDCREFQYIVGTVQTGTSVQCMRCPDNECIKAHVVTGPHLPR